MDDFQVDLTKSTMQWDSATKLRRGIWSFIIQPIYRLIPGKKSKIRISLLRMMGARIGRCCMIQQRVDILIPWNLVIHDRVAIAHDCRILNFDTVEIQPMTVISQHTHLCTGTHDYSHPHFPLTMKPITIEPESWVASGAFIGPGVRLGRGCVIGANSVVTKDMPEWMVCAGNPCKPLKPRIIDSSDRL